MVAVLALVFFLVSCGVNPCFSICNRNTVSKVHSITNLLNKSNVLSDLRGTWTSVKSNISPNSELKCIGPSIDPEKNTVVVIITLKNGTITKPMNATNIPGGFKVVSTNIHIPNGTFTGFEHIAYLKNDVAATYSCAPVYLNDGHDEEYEVWVRNYKEVKDKPETKAAIAEAQAVLQKVATHRVYDYPTCV